MLSRLKIGPKLLLAPGAVLVLLVVLSCSAYYAMVRQNQSLEIIVHQRAVQMRSAADLAASAQKAHADIYRLLSWISGSFPRSRTDPLIGQIQGQHAALDAGLAKLAKLTGARGAERRFVDQAAAAHKRYVRAVEDVIEMAHNDQSISANAMQKAEDAFNVVAQRLTELSRLEQELGARASRVAADDFRFSATLMPVLIVLSIALSLAITVAVRRALLDEIRAIGAAATHLASCDLTVGEREYGSDEIAQAQRALDASIRNLNGSLRTILEAARSIGSASRDIALGNLNLTTRAVFRSSSLEHTASSMQELAATVHLTVDSANAANLLAGLSEVNEAIVQMDQVSQRNAALVEEAANAARGLQQQAITLSRAVAAFRLDEAVQEPAPTAAAPVRATAPAVHNRRRNPAHPHLVLAARRD